MNCNLCGDLSSPPAAEGPCAVQSHLYVCTRGRPDNTVHGERCRCHCDNLFCLTHARAHLDDIGYGTMPECFPALSMSLAGPVLMASVGITLRRADAGGADNSTLGSDKNMSRRAIALFLTYGAPGFNSIMAAQATTGGITDLEVADDQLWPITRLQVTDAFLTSNRLEKTMGVAMRLIADVYARYPDLVRDVATDVRNPSRLPRRTRLEFVDTLLEKLGVQLEIDDTPVAGLMAYIEATRILSGHPRATEDSVSPLITNALQHAATAPRSEYEQAEWLIAPDELEQPTSRTRLRALVT